MQRENAVKIGALLMILGAQQACAPTVPGTDVVSQDAVTTDTLRVDVPATDTGQSCPLTANTQSTGMELNHCTLLTRDTSACRADREAAGLSGAWLEFSCRVGLGRTTVAGREHVHVSSDGQPDYASIYFPTSNACYTSVTNGMRNPNSIRAQSLGLDVPLQGDAVEGTTMGSIGIALNGVLLFDNRALPTDDIYLEAQTFDPCQGHPQMTGYYHYHSEPYALSFDDSRLIGVIRDGIFYGRRDQDGTLPTLDNAGGHTGPTPHSAVPVYHYHVNQQTSTTPGSAGMVQYFLSKGRYHGSAGACAGCP